MRAEVGERPALCQTRSVPEDFFGAGIAEHYDEWTSEMFDPEEVEPAVAFLAELAGGGPALELGVGTGRIALPLSARGIPVHGIDLSAAMVAELRRKPGAERVEVTLGDFARTRLDGEFPLAYLVFNTIVNLTAQDQQVACFENVAAHLSPRRRFVIEVNTPQLQRLPPGETFRPVVAGPDRVSVDEIDVVTQRLVSHHYRVFDGTLKLRSIPFRYVWPSELDLMARLAGMSLRERWGSWRRDPFTALSAKHISVWEKD